MLGIRHGPLGPDFSDSRDPIRVRKTPKKTALILMIHKACTVIHFELR